MMRQSIEAWIYHPEEREILLLKVEDETVSFWQPITGGIESGESPEEACPVSYTHLIYKTNDSLVIIGFFYSVKNGIIG